MSMHKASSNFFLRQYELHQVRRVTSHSGNAEAPKVLTKNKKLLTINIFQELFSYAEHEILTKPKPLFPIPNTLLLLLEVFHLNCAQIN
jgi:hypothetical protein